MSIRLATKVMKPDRDAVEAAARCLRDGGLVAFPTETVYGLGCDAGNGEAVARLYAAKGRPSFNPLIAHVGTTALARRLGSFNAAAERLTMLWPGALTLVVPKAPDCPVADLATAGLDTIALRVPNHAIARDILTAFRNAIVAPSANRSGHVSPTTADHVLADLRGRIDLVIDGGPAPLGLESTIVSCVGARPMLLRPGGVTRGAIEEVLGETVIDPPATTDEPANGDVPLAPGQLPSHYAPRAALRLDAKSVHAGEALLAFGRSSPQGHSQAAKVLNLSTRGDLVEAAANLFAYLRALDGTQVASIAVMPIPHAGLGEAINDRLHRAAAPRDPPRTMAEFVERSKQYRARDESEEVEFEQSFPMDFPRGAIFDEDDAQDGKLMTRRLAAAADADLLSRFAAIVGANYAITDPVAQEPYLIEQRDLYRGRTPMVLRPGTVGEVAAILKLANETTTPIVPQGGNTGLVGGQVPHEQGDELVLSLTRLDRIREVDATSSTMTCEAGVVLQKAQDAAAGAGRLFPLSLGAKGSCTIGGNLSTNAGGTGALAYGNARDLVLGLEVVLADGRVWNGLSKLKKDNTGYDLKNLFIGAEGTLGIITAAVLKLFPAPRDVETAFIGVASPAAALALFDLAQERAGGMVTGFELMPRLGLEFVVRHAPGAREPLGGAHAWYVLLELSSQAQEGLRATLEEVLAAGYESGDVEDAAIADSLDRRNALWRLREALAEVQRFEGGSIKHDVSVPVTAIPDFIAAANAAVEAYVPGCRPVPFGHVGDGNIHYNVSQPIGADKAGFLAQWNAVNAIVHGIVADFGGSISAEHGIGRLKRELLVEVKDPVALDLMRALKRTLDPKGILNPGKVL